MSNYSINHAVLTMQTRCKIISECKQYIPLTVREPLLHFDMIITVLSADRKKCTGLSITSLLTLPIAIPTEHPRISPTSNPFQYSDFTIQLFTLLGVIER